MDDFIKASDFILVMAAFVSAITFPVIVLIVSVLFKIPFSSILNAQVIIVIGKLFGIVLIAMLLLHLSIQSDGLSSQLIYGRF
jgi:hypothetical protein